MDAVTAQLYTEMREEGTIRLDTRQYLERELSRLIEALNENDKIALPSALLLQIERTAKMLAGSTSSYSKSCCRARLISLRHLRLCSFQPISRIRRLNRITLT